MFAHKVWEQLQPPLKDLLLKTKIFVSSGGMKGSDGTFNQERWDWLYHHSPDAQTARDDLKKDQELQIKIFFQEGKKWEALTPAQRKSANQFGYADAEVHAETDTAQSTGYWDSQHLTGEMLKPWSSLSEAQKTAALHLIGHKGEEQQSTTEADTPLQEHGEEQTQEDAKLR
eukprot:SAG11_NODE_235_length_11852_cov_4.266020_15_plen_172_part_00